MDILLIYKINIPLLKIPYFYLELKERRYKDYSSELEYQQIKKIFLFLSRIKPEI